MSRRPLDALRALRRSARRQAEARFSAELAGLRVAEERAARCAEREGAHIAGRLRVASARLAVLETPGRGTPVGRAQLHETRERLLRAEEVLLAFGRQRAALRVAESIRQVAERQALLRAAELHLEVVERLLAHRAAAEKVRRRRREERDADDYSSSRNSSL
jgi:hypothetical protein